MYTLSLYGKENEIVIMMRMVINRSQVGSYSVIVDNPGERREFLEIRLYWFCGWIGRGG